MLCYVREDVSLVIVIAGCIGCRGKREALPGEACGSSWRGELRGRVGFFVLAAVIRYGSCWS